MKRPNSIQRARVVIAEFQYREAAKRLLLGMESLLTIPVFILSWLICAIGFSAVAGFLMAKAQGADKSAILNKTLGAKSKP